MISVVPNWQKNQVNTRWTCEKLGFDECNEWLEVINYLMLAGCSIFVASSCRASCKIWNPTSLLTNSQDVQLNIIWWCSQWPVTHYKKTKCTRRWCCEWLSNFHGNRCIKQNAVISVMWPKWTCGKQGFDECLAKYMNEQLGVTI